QTSAAQGLTWRAEYEPYGAIFSLRSPDQHQPLRLPGHEAEQLGEGANGSTSRSYNIHRWYQPGAGRYETPDPLLRIPRRAARRLADAPNAFLYARANPARFSDPLGLIDFPTAPAEPTKDCNFSRYKPCCGENAVVRWCCKKLVDFSCKHD